MSSFNFNTSATGLGSTSTPQKPLTFGAPQNSFGGFATPAATSAPPPFGASTSTFGATPALGQQNNNAPSFGFGSAQQQTSAVQPSFGFGSQVTSTAAPSFGLGAPTSTAAPSFGFGQSAPTATSTAFGFGGSVTSAAPAFGFGSTTATSTAPPAFGFGSSAPVQSNSLFGGNSGGFGGFGTNTTAAPTGGGLFGNTGSAFGTGTAFGQNQFLQQQQQQQQQQIKPLSPEEMFSQSIFNVSVFGDERDSTLARWNYLQALLGTGKAFYSQSQAPVTITPQNYLCKFKAMGYSRIPGKDNKMGHVALKFNKPANQVKEQEQQLIQKLSQLFGNKPNMIIHIDSIKPLSETSSQVVMYIEEKSPSNEVKRIAATETAGYLNQAHLKYQITPVGIEEVTPMIPPDEDQLKQYLDNPPKGIDARMWRQAISDNPESTKFIPVPHVGFGDLKSRLSCQENETSSHMGYLAKLEKDVGELKQRQSNTTSKIVEHRRKFAELSHRILKIIVKQESSRKAGLALTPEEEAIKTKLENMHALVSAPTQFKGKLSELLSQMRMQRSQWGSGGWEYTLDASSIDEMKNFLTVQQNAMQFLIQTVNKDMKDLKIISDGLAQINSTPVM